MCFTFTPESISVRVGVSSEGNASYFDVSKLMWRTAHSDKGILSLFMPPLRHFNLEMLNILITLFSSAQTADLTLTSCFLFIFFFPPQKTAQQAKELSQRRKNAATSKVASDISRFFIRK